LREQQVLTEFPESTEINNRLDTVLTTLYLLFNEGYYSNSDDKTLRKDLCLEAMRLLILLTHYPPTNLPKVNALLSLMCFHASRMEARLTEEGELILYEDQDRNSWNQELIEKGEYYLNKSSTGKRLSKYHLEAGIAYWHTQEEDQEKWDNILQLYNYLLRLDYSPIAALNRTYALAKANNPEKALQEALKLKLESSSLYYCLLAELYLFCHQKEQAAEQLNYALSLTKSTSEQGMIRSKLEKIIDPPQDVG